MPVARKLPDTAASGADPDIAILLTSCTQPHDAHKATDRYCPASSPGEAAPTFCPGHGVDYTNGSWPGIATDSTGRSPNSYLSAERSSFDCMAHFQLSIRPV